MKKMTAFCVSLILIVNTGCLGDVELPASHTDSNSASSQAEVENETTSGLYAADQSGRLYPAHDNTTGKAGYINKYGQWVIEPIYDEVPSILRMASNDQTDLLPVGVDGKWGYLNRDGDWHIPPQFNGECGYFYDGVANAIFVGENRVSFIDINGNKISPDLTGNSHFFEGLVIKYAEGVSDNRDDGRDMYGYIDKLGNWIIEPQFTFPVNGGSSANNHDFSEGLAVMFNFDNKKYGYINKSGEWQIEAQFDQAKPFSDGFAAVMADNLWGYIDQQGNWSITPQYERAASFSEGLAGVYINEKWGFLNYLGELNITPHFHNPNSWEMPEFHENYAVIGILSDNNKVLYGYIDRTGSWVVPAQFTTAKSFYDGVAVVKNEIMGVEGYINHTGEYILSWNIA